MAEAPEGIVVYSWSGASPYPGATGILVGKNAFVDTNDYGAEVPQKYLDTEYLGLTDTLVETLDLICEGEIEGPLSGLWVYSGNIGQTGWTSAQFSGYLTPPGYNNVGWMRSVYWNELPVLSNAGQFNFQNVDLAYTIGLPNGDTIQQLTNQETTSRTIGTQLYAGGENSQTFRILNQNCKGCIVNIRFPSLSNTTSDGNILRTYVQYMVSYRPIFSTINQQSVFTPPITDFVFGKITTAGGYIKSTQLNFDLTSFILYNQSLPNGQQLNNQLNFLYNPNFIGWEVLIQRTTPDSNSALLVNASYIDSLTELYGTQLSYPNSAIIRQTFDAQFFAQVPERGFECNLIKVSIPANYNPILRTYATTGYGTYNGGWDGTFASGKYWTNNPAWCFYDLVTNTRYGLGKYVTDLGVDKFDLYSIGQYCDELVADGYGYLEPRFTCNVWIAQKEEAYKVINDMSSIFRGLVYYFNGNLNVTQDSPKTNRITFTNSNVEEGDFNYSSTSKSTRQSVAVIRYNDPKNFYKPAIEYVEDLDSIRRYGVRELPIIAFGCTSRGQAIRLGKWALYSNNLETETVSFVAGLETNLLRCGDIFEVVDFNRKLKRYGGRILQINNTGNTGIGYTGASILLDSAIQTQSGVDYSLSVVTPTFYYNPSQVTGLTSNDYSNIYRSFIQTFDFSGDSSYISGNYSIINLTSGLDTTNYNISGNPIWSVELGQNSLNYTGNYYFSSSTSDYYRVINIKETDINKYQIIGLSYQPQKFAQIDTGLVLQQNQIPNLLSAPYPPSHLTLSLFKLNNSQSYIEYSFLPPGLTQILPNPLGGSASTGIQFYPNRNISNYVINVYTGISSSNTSLFSTSVIPPNINNAVYFPTFTGYCYFSMASYNYTSNTYSSYINSNGIVVSSNNAITDVTIGGLYLIN